MIRSYHCGECVNRITSAAREIETLNTIAPVEQIRMSNATIGDGVATVYEFDWQNGPTRTSDEIGDLETIDATIADIVELGRDDPDCTVRVIGFSEA